MTVDSSSPVTGRHNFSLALDAEGGEESISLLSGDSVKAAAARFWPVALISISANATDDMRPTVVD